MIRLIGLSCILIVKGGTDSELNGRDHRVARKSKILQIKTPLTDILELPEISPAHLQKIGFVPWIREIGIGPVEAANSVF